MGKEFTEEEIREQSIQMNINDDMGWDDESDLEQTPESADPKLTEYINKGNVLSYTTYFENIFSWEEELVETCEFFKKKYGVYPNAIGLSKDTFLRLDEATNQLIIEESGRINNPYNYKMRLGLVPESETKNIEDDDEPCYVDISKRHFFSYPGIENPDIRLELLYNTSFAPCVFEVLRLPNDFVAEPNLLDESAKKSEKTYPVVDQEKTAANLKMLMEKEGVTQVLLARFFNISKQAVNSWVTGKSLPSLDNFAVLARILNRPIEELIVTYDVET